MVRCSLCLSSMQQREVVWNKLLMAQCQSSSIKLVSTYIILTPDNKNMLEHIIWHTLSCIKMVAFARTLTLFDLLLSFPLRWS